MCVCVWVRACVRACLCGVASFKRATYSVQHACRVNISLHIHRELSSGAIITELALNTTDDADDAERARSPASQLKITFWSFPSLLIILFRSRKRGVSARANSPSRLRGRVPVSNENCVLRNNLCNCYEICINFTRRM